MDDIRLLPTGLKSSQRPFRDPAYRRLRPGAEPGCSLAAAGAFGFVSRMLQTPLLGFGYLRGVPEFWSRLFYRARGRRERARSTFCPRRIFGPPYPAVAAAPAGRARSLRPVAPSVLPPAFLRRRPRPLWRRMLRCSSADRLPARQLRGSCGGRLCRGLPIAI